MCLLVLVSVCGCKIGESKRGGARADSNKGGCAADKHFNLCHLKQKFDFTVIKKMVLLLFKTAFNCDWWRQYDCLQNLDFVNIILFSETSLLKRKEKNIITMAKILQLEPVLQ